MADSRTSRVATVLRRILHRVLGWDEKHVVRELDELYQSRAARRGGRPPRAWYARQVGWFVLRWLVAKIGWTAREVGGIGPDLRVALRTLRRRPGYAVTFAATLGLGVGALTTVHAAARHVLLRPVPGVVQEDRLVTLRLTSSEAPPHVSWDIGEADRGRLQAALTGLQAVAGVTSVDVNMAVGGGTPERVTAEIVEPTYFPVLGTRLVAGVAPAAETGDEVVVSQRLARRWAGTAAGALGRPVQVNGRTFLVAGVAPRGFRGAELPGAAELWLGPGAFTTLHLGDAPAGGSGPRRPLWQHLVGRLAPGATVAGVQGAADAVLEGMRARQEFTRMTSVAHFRIEVNPGVGLDPGVRLQVRRTLRLLAGAAAFLLFIALANVGALGLAHAAAERPASALRLTLGSGGFRIVRHTLVEAVLLGMAGACAGLLLAVVWSRHLVGASLARTGAPLADLGISGTVVLGAFATAVAASVLAMLLPALRSSAVGPVAALRSARHGDVVGQRLRAVLVAMQAAVAVTLVVGAGLLLRSVGNLAEVPLGFPVEDAVVLHLDPGPQLGGEERVRLLEDLEAALRRIPGLSAAGFSNHPLFSGSYITNAYTTEPQGELSRGVAQYEVTPGFLATLRPRLLAGELDVTDGGVVVSRSLAAMLFPDLPPSAVVGRSIFSPQDEGAPRQVGGVFEDVATNSWIMETPLLAFSRLDATTPISDIQGWVRAPGVDAGRLRAALADAVGREAGLPVFRVEEARAAAARLHAERTVLADTAVATGGLGLLLTAVGLYGILSYMVVERRREIGVRAALGAAPDRLLAAVVRRGLVLALAGGTVGLVGAAAMGRLLRSQLYGLSALDTPTYVAGMLILLAVATAASWLPARRATRVDPMEVLRSE